MVQFGLAPAPIEMARCSLYIADEIDKFALALVEFSRTKRPFDIDALVMSMKNGNAKVKKMNIKPVTFEEVLAWLERLEISIKSVRRVSVNCTNIYLWAGGVLSHYDAGTLVLQGNLPSSTIRHFLNLRESVDLTNMPTKNVEAVAPNRARLSNSNGFDDPAPPSSPCDLDYSWSGYIEHEVGQHDEYALDGSGINVSVDLKDEWASAGVDATIPHEITSPSTSHALRVPIRTSPASKSKASPDCDW